MVDSALEGIKQPRLKVFVDGSKLEGWEPRAAWNDFKFGLKHNGEFEKIAIFGNKKWHPGLFQVGLNTLKPRMMR
ncbi:MAG: STAS/SEC14 domain-containing protein [Methylococcales bacterium]|nr:STAS/SEC14 domain-containing protein [Methylococcales bacterium]